jgi:hypothetical protein
MPELITDLGQIVSQLDAGFILYEPDAASDLSMLVELKPDVTYNVRGGVFLALCSLLHLDHEPDLNLAEAAEVYKEKFTTAVLHKPDSNPVFCIVSKRNEAALQYRIRPYKET